MVCQWFGLKTTVTVFSGLTSKSVVMISSDFASKLLAMILSGLTLNSMMTVSTGLASKPMVGFLVEPQTQGDGGFLGLDIKTASYGLVI
jgi:hypothetical protein